MADWVEIAVPTPVAAADEVAAQLVDLVPSAAAGTEVRKNEIVFWVEVPESEAALEQARSAARELVKRGYGIDVQQVEMRPAMPEAEWREAWKRYFHVTRLTRQIVIVPSWETYDAAKGLADDLLIDLDPGQAFGTGAHATTRLVLQELQTLRDQGEVVTRFLDVGAGSGILSIATALLWPDSTAVAVDNDPIAVDATAENAAHNNIGARIRSTDELPDVEQFELVLANIQADVLRQLQPRISRCAAPGARLILSGLLAAHVRGVAELYADSGFDIERIETDEKSDWCCATLRRHNSEKHHPQYTK